MKVGFWPLLSPMALALVCACCLPAATHHRASGPGPARRRCSSPCRPGRPGCLVRPGGANARQPLRSETPLDPGSGARDAAIAAAEAAVPQRYPPHIDVAGFRVTGAYPADQSPGYGSIAYGPCGAIVAQRTRVVELSFPKMALSVDLSAGQLFLIRFAGGRKVWFQYQ